MPQEYKVSNIEETPGADGSPRWVISLQDKKVTLAVREEPTYKIGDMLPFEIELIKPEKGRWYYKRRGITTQASRSAEAPKSESRKSYGKSPEEQESIERQVDKKMAAEIYCHVTEAGAEFDKSKLFEIYRACHTLPKSSLVEEAKKMGAVEQ